MDRKEPTLAVLPGMTFSNPIIKDRVTFLETAESSRGACTRVLVKLAPNGGNSMHRHLTYTETFRPLHGTLGVQLGKEEHHVVPGAKAVAPIAAMHRFFNPSKTEWVEFEVELTPASVGFERCIAYAYGLASDGLTTKGGVPKRIKDLALVAYWSDTFVGGVAGVLMKWLVGWGRSLDQKNGYQLRLGTYIQRAREGMAASRAMA